MNETEKRQAGSELERIVVSSGMATAGAEVLREARIGSDLRELATDVFYRMQAEAQAERVSASMIKSL